MSQLKAGCCKMNKENKKIVIYGDSISTTEFGGGGYQQYLEKMNQYRGDAFLFQREKEPNAFVGALDTPPYFLPLKYNLPPVYDLNNLYRIMIECEHAGKKKKS